MDINNNILSVIERTPDSVMKAVAERVRQRRLERDWTQQLLASKADLPLATYRRFERTGEVSFRGLVMIAFALGVEDELQELFTRRTYRSMDELLNASAGKQRKRGGRNE